MKRRKAKRPPVARGPSPHPRLALLAMSAVLVVLCVPRLGLGYLWDDYIFVTSAQAHPLAFVLPNPTTIFFRPISMGLYFLPLALLGPSGAGLGHSLNLAMLVACVLLLSSLASKVAGPRAGILSGFAFASLGAMPALAVWITTSQDILAILFLLVAFHFRHAGRLGEATLAAACAAFSKETALALFPALVLWPWLLRRPPYRLGTQALLLGAVALAWAAVHPGVHAFLKYGVHSAATGYVHLQDPKGWAIQALRYLLLLFHVPVGAPAVWPPELTTLAAIAAAILVVGVWVGLSGTQRGEVGLGRIAALAGLMALPPLLLDIVLIGHLAPYYTCLPGVGFALLLGAFLSRFPRPVSVAVLGVFLLSGVRCRGLDAPELAFTEVNMVRASRAVRTVEARFREARPSVPRGSELLISVGITGTLGMNQTIQQGQAPRLWYRDPTLMVHLPQQMEGRRSDALFRLTTDLTVTEIQPATLDYHWAGDVEPDPDEIAAAARSYARGAAACGRTDLSVRVLGGLASAMPETMQVYDRHLTAMVLFAGGRDAQAESILARTSPFPPELTARMIRKLLREPTGRANVDTSVFRAFGMSRDAYAAALPGLPEDK